MLINKIIIIVLSFIFVITAFSGCILFGSTNFTLISSTIGDYEGFPTIDLNFNISDKVTVSLLNPQNTEIYSNIFYKGIHGISIPLDSYRTNPSTGSYNLIAYDSSDRDIFEQELNFVGSDLSILSVNERWLNEEIWNDNFSLVGLDMQILNSGDLPAYPYNIEVSINEESSNAIFLPEVILPSMSETICCFIYMNGIPDDSEQINIVIKDKTGTTISEKTLNIAPIGTSQIVKYSWSYKGYKIITMPYPECLYNYYSNLDRIILEDYAAYVFDVYDEDYIDVFVDKIVDSLDDDIDDVDKINSVASIVQNMQYVEDENGDAADCEYPRFPVEMLIDEEGDCEDKAILTAQIFNNMGYDVCLIRLPDHMAVGVHLDSDATAFDYYVDEYYYLETTRENWLLGRVPNEYEGISNITIHTISSRPIILHNWKNATRYSSSVSDDYVKMSIVVENIGNDIASDVVVKGGFHSDSGYVYNEEQTSISFLSPGDKKIVDLQVNIPEGITTLLKSQIFLDNDLVDEKQSKSTFS